MEVELIIFVNFAIIKNEDNSDINSFTLFWFGRGQQNPPLTAFLGKNWYQNVDATDNTTIPTMVSSRPLQQCRFNIYMQSSTNTLGTRGWGRGWSKRFNGIDKMVE
jgi:hypothetical protein